MTWENLLMNVSCLSAIILTFVGITKMFFKNFKTKHPKCYKAVFFILSVGLVVAGSIVSQLYIVEEELASLSFVILILGTAVVVLGGYQGYECTGLKAGLKKLFAGIGKLLSRYNESKITKFVQKVGVEKIQSAINALPEDKPAAETKEEANEVKEIAETEKPVEQEAKIDLL